MIQGLDGRYTCTSELTSEKTEVRVIFPSIVTRRWVMYTRKIVSIVFWCEVWDLLQNVCLCDGSFNFTFVFAFSSKYLLTSLNWIAPTVLRGTPIRASYGRCKIICCIALKKPGGKIFSNLQSNTGAILSISWITVIDTSLAQSWRKKKLNSASTRHIWSGR